MVYDIGAGSGIITSELAVITRKVVAVENDPAAVKLLKQNTAGFHNIDIIESDIQSVSLPDSRYKVFANIPFSLSAEITRLLTMGKNQPAAIYLILQQQFAKKLIMSDQHFTAQLGAQIAPWWQARIVRKLQPTDFTPEPQVETVLLELLPHQMARLPLSQQSSYHAFVEQCYARQKYFGSLNRSKAGIDPEKKPSELSVDDWVRLYQL